MIPLCAGLVSYDASAVQLTGTWPLTAAWTPLSMTPKKIMDADAATCHDAATATARPLQIIAAATGSRPLAEQGRALHVMTKATTRPLLVCACDILASLTDASDRALKRRFSQILEVRWPDRILSCQRHAVPFAGQTV